MNNFQCSVLDSLFAAQGSARPTVLVVVAHPDDEVIGVGAQLPAWPQARFLHVTDGAPRGMADATAAGFATRAEYANARSAELHRALALAGVGRAQLEQLNIPDQQASFALVEVSLRLQARLAELRPDVVITHPYEGGHPDHDATAFAVHAALELLEPEIRPVTLEMASYFNSGGSMATGRFLPAPGAPARELALSAAQRELKQRMFDCYATQKKVLQYFPIGIEALRVAPRYDFTCPPHEGTLYYELFDWGITGAQWRGKAAEALRALGLE